ncbi:MAG: hypothetical protein V4564_21150 [Pseudomonadota bacterium]|uniref:hypothetical protein n=1 Tax=Sphingomonas sp. ERG5 TaxID=1381597 RepID=UPI00054B8082|nr:hypothetical protein [Sphingomonas sp. ERG5]
MIIVVLGGLIGVAASAPDVVQAGMPIDVQSPSCEARFSAIKLFAQRFDILRQAGSINRKSPNPGGMISA